MTHQQQVAKKHMEATIRGKPKYQEEALISQCQVCGERATGHSYYGGVSCFCKFFDHLNNSLVQVLIFQPVELFFGVVSSKENYKVA